MFQTHVTLLWEHLRQTQKNIVFFYFTKKKRPLDALDTPYYPLESSSTDKRKYLVSISAKIFYAGNEHDLLIKKVSDFFFIEIKFRCEKICQFSKICGKRFLSEKNPTSSFKIGGFRDQKMFFKLAEISLIISLK